MENLIQQIRMERVDTLKHLGVHIDNQGNLPHDKNTRPLTNTMKKIAESFNSSLYTQLGRSIYAKYLLGSEYLNRVLNFVFSEDQLKELRKSIIKLTWTRESPEEHTNGYRVHIA